MFAREGYPFMMGALALAALAYVGALRMRSWPLWLLAFTLTVIALWVAWFFRNPERAGERGEQVVVSPADGRVVLITHIDEPTFVDGPTVRVSVFMNVFDVHVNRYPVNGRVEHVVHKAGKFLNAVTEASSVENEQASVGILSGSHRILVRQIAGLIARRIITDSAPGDAAVQGARMGLIRFGSRVDVFLPPQSRLRVAVGQRMKAGETVLADLPVAGGDLT
ncbi:phosphatidylserine decarboxylase family protein [Gemmatimonas aurantiaca]|uniref:phosphatidylserine decarboxylase family protein n=1 Tax=Gemmatimonas aurantiaca TaxID=173480 RepID=UPI00301E33AB